MSGAPQNSGNAAEQGSYGFANLQMRQALKLLVLHLMTQPQLTATHPYPRKYGQLRHATFSDAYRQQDGWTGKDLEDLIVALTGVESWRPSPHTLYIDVLDHLVYHELLTYKERGSGTDDNKTAAGRPRVGGLPKLHRALVYRINDNPNGDPSRPLLSMMASDRENLRPHLLDAAKVLQAVDRLCYGESKFEAGGEGAMGAAPPPAPDVERGQIGKIGMRAAVSLLVIGRLMIPDRASRYAYPEKRGKRVYADYAAAYRAKGGFSRIDLMDLVNRDIGASHWRCSLGLMYEDVIPVLVAQGILTTREHKMTRTETVYRLGGDMAETGTLFRQYSVMKRLLAPHFRDATRIIDTINQICYRNRLQS